MSDLQTLVDAHKASKQALYEAIYARAQEITDEVQSARKERKGRPLLTIVRSKLSEEVSYYPLYKGNLDALLVAAMNDEDFAGPTKIIRWDD